MGRIEKANPATLNPCHKESDLTYKCLDDNNYDRDKCLKAMENYQLCKSFWVSTTINKRFTRFIEDLLLLGVCSNSKEERRQIPFTST